MELTGHNEASSSGLSGPVYSGTWKDDTEAFIGSNYEAIISDCLGFLQKTPEYKFEEYSRWGNWERDVLARLPEPAGAQRVILERQREADVEGQESSDLENHYQ